MLAFLLRRVITSIVVIIGVATVVFGLMHAIPGDPVSALLGTDATPQAREIMRRDLGLDRSILVQYLNWWRDIFRGDLGRSIMVNQPVSSLIVERAPVTLPLAFLAFVIAIAVALPAGVLAAIRRNTWVDAIVSVVAFTGMAIPDFWLGVLLILGFSLYLGWLPPGGYVSLFDSPLQSFQHLILPSAALGFTFAASLTRMVRSSMLEVLNRDYIRTARAKGQLERRVLYSHALRNSLIPAVTIMGVQLGSLLGGTLIIEQVFALPGLGRLTIQAVLDRDFPLVQGCVLIIAAAFVLANLLTDLVYVVLDPRIRYG